MRKKKGHMTHYLVSTVIFPHAVSKEGIPSIIVCL